MRVLAAHGLLLGSERRSLGSVEDILIPTELWIVRGDEHGCGHQGFLGRVSLLETTAISIVPFGDVTEEHAHSEGEGDLTLAAWREIHERFWRKYPENPRGYEPDMPVICERFRVAYTAPES